MKEVLIKRNVSGLYFIMNEHKIQSKDLIAISEAIEEIGVAPISKMAITKVKYGKSCTLQTYNKLVRALNEYFKNKGIDKCVSIENMF